MDEALEEWFIREILSHEAALTRYIGRAWPNSADVPDLRQEIYVRVLETAENAPPASPKYFLFTVARNLIIDRARRQRIVPIDLLQDCDSLDVLVDEVSPERSAGSFQQLVNLVAAFERLPQRCREVLWMKKIEDLSQKEIAGRLGVKEGTVEAHLVRGMRLLAKHFHEGAEFGQESARRGVRSTEELLHGD
jgi:RNA polymerase sigma factor (sigma-70 family)